MPDGPVTLATIAAHLGVSRSTVSNAYNHPDQLSPALRDRILDTANALGYNGPDPVARRLRKGRAGAIGVLFSEPLQTAFADPASVLFLEGVAMAGEAADSGMLLIPAKPSAETARVVQEAMVDGFILYSIPPGHPFVDAALRRRVPVVCVDQTRIEGTLWVGIDDRAASREAAQYILGAGHRKIAVLVYGLGPGNPGDVDLEGKCPSVSGLRMQGCHDALRAAGINWKDVPVVECRENTVEFGQAAAASLLKKPDGVTAILCSSDRLALGALRAAGDAGVAVPSQLSVVGFNDIPEASDAGLTTVRQPLRDKGVRAANMLLHNDTATGRGVALESTLIVRSTTAKAPSAPG